MEGVGLLVLFGIFILILVVFSNSCVENFQTGAQTVPPVLSKVANLPVVYQDSLATTNSLPYEDPALEKSTGNMLNELKGDMDGFAQNELPGLLSIGDNDPSVTLPATRFRGDYQRVKDEVLVIQGSPGLQPQLTIEDIDEMAANLRFLQRIYRTYSVNQMLPDSGASLSKVSASANANADAEGFDDYEPVITQDELNLLSLKLKDEITRLTASGTSDPVLQARVGIFTRIGQTIDDMIVRLKNNSMAPSDIPIKVKDYDKFLPVIGSSVEMPIGNLFSAKQTLPKEEIAANSNPRGEFEEKIMTLDSNNTEPGFNWKRRVQEITENIRRSNMDPADFGCLDRGVVVGPEFSWRGHTKMVCSRLSSTADPGTPEQMGCPPVSWRGWRS
jgi:hypothetical protein